MAFADLTNKVFQRLTVIRRAANSIYGSRSIVAWICQCSCGNIITVSAAHLTAGHSRSCGCLSREVTGNRVRRHNHRSKRTPEYLSWIGAKGRCFNLKNPAYKRYGGRGVTMCEEWKNDFSAFFKAMGKRPRGYTLERIDNDGPYSPNNCIWATHYVQGGNKRNNRLLTVNDETHHIAEWARRLNIDHRTLSCRLKSGWSVEKTLLTPLLSGKRQ